MSIKCEICGKEFDKLKSLSIHLRFHKNMTVEIYYKKYIMTENDNNGVCHNENCNNKTFFNGLLKGYLSWCSKNCAMNSIFVKEKKDKTCIEKYGYKVPFQNKEIREKIKRTNLKKFGVECTLQNKEIREKIKRTNLKKFGVENPSQNKEVRKKIKQTCIDRYGFENVIQNEEIKSKRKKTNIEKYGVECTLQNKEIKEKIKRTCLDKFGVENPSQNKEVRKKIKQTCLEKYGVEHPSQSENIKEKSKQTCLQKYGVEYISQSDEFKEKILNNVYNSLFENRLQGLVEPLFSREEYFGVKNNKYKFRCLKCINEFEYGLNRYSIPRCPTCFPYTISKGEQELLNFISEHIEVDNIITNDRKVLDGRELDIYLPKNDLAIEFNGLYFHSEENGKDNSYHLKKTLDCEKKGIKLIHIFEDEWNNKQDIIKSIVLRKIEKIQKEIDEFDCDVKEIDEKTSEEFLNQNHLEGYVKGLSFGMFYENELTSVITYKKTKNRGKVTVDILRFCDKINISVKESLKRFIEVIVDKETPNRVTSFIDRRSDTGDIYLKNGFSIRKNIKPVFYYVKNGIRYKEEHLLENEEVTSFNDYFKIWDCGNIVFEYKLRTL